MFNAKKCFSVFFAGVYFLFAVNTFAAEGNKIFYDDNYNKSIVSSIPNDNTSVSIKSESDSFDVDDEFDVTFRLKNNPGFSSYSFKIEYDDTIIEPVSASVNACEVKYSYNSKTSSTIIDQESIKAAVDGKKNNSFSVSGFCMNGAGNLVKSYGDGMLFTVRFKAVGSGKSIIDLGGSNGFIFQDSKNKKFPVYVESFIVNVKGNVKSDVSKETITEAATTTTEVTTKAVTTMTEATTETTTYMASEETTSVFQLNVPKNISKPIEFKDMNPYPWAKESVNLLSSLGIVRGGTGSYWRKFKPEFPISRADFLIIAKRLSGIEGPVKTNFEDVDIKSYYAEAIGVMTNAGLASGVTETKFLPEENITRQEVCVILAKILEKAGKLKNSDVSILDKFDDEDFISPYARQYIADLIDMGVISGNSEKRIRPGQPIIRAEVAVIVAKVYNLIK